MNLSSFSAFSVDITSSSGSSSVQFIEEDNPDIMYDDDHEMDVVYNDDDEMDSDEFEEPMNNDDSMSNFQKWRERPLYDLKGEGGGSWDDFFDKVDNQCSEADIEEQSPDDEERLQRMRELCYGSMSPVSESAFRLDPTQGVSTLPVKKAICYGVCSIDEAEPLKLLKCAKCSMFIKPISYGHHMRFHHKGEIAPATSQDEDNMCEDVVSNNDCQDFLLSPLHACEDDVTDLMTSEESTNLSIAPPLAESPTLPEKEETDSQYVVEKKENLKMLFRSSQKTVAKIFKRQSKKSGDSSKKVKCETLTSKQQQKRSVDRQRKKKNDGQENKSDTKSTFKQPKQRKVVLSTSTAAGPSSSAIADPAADQPASSTLEQEEGARRAADVQMRALSAQYDDATSRRDVRVVVPFPAAGSAPASVRSSPSSATGATYFAIPQRRLSSSSLALQSATSHDERSLSNGYSNMQEAYPQKVSASSSLAVSGNETQMLHGRVNIDMLNYADFPTTVNRNCNNVVDSSGSVVLPSSIHHHQQQLQQSIVRQSIPNYNTVVHHQQHTAIHSFAHGRLAAVKPVARQYHHFLPTTSQQQQQSENFGNNFVNNNVARHENGGYIHNNINEKVRPRGAPSSQLDNAELRHQKQMMLRAAQVIGANSSGIAHLRAQKRLFYVDDRDLKDTNGMQTNMDRVEGMPQRPSTNHLVKKFRPIMPRMNPMTGNVNMADQRNYEHYPVNFQLALNCGRHSDVQMSAGVPRLSYSNATTNIASTQWAPSGAPSISGGMRSIAPKTYPIHRVATFYPVAPKRLTHSATDGLTPNFTVRYGRASFAQSTRYAAGHYVAGELNNADKPATFTTTANGRIACRVYASKGFATTQQQTAVPYEFEKKRHLSTTTPSSSSSHPLIVHSKTIENSLHLQNIEPPPVLEAEGCINTNMTSDHSHFTSTGDDNLY